MRGNLTHRTKKRKVPLAQGTTYPNNKDFLKQVQGIDGNGSTYQKFHLTEVPIIENQLYVYGARRSHIFRKTLVTGFTFSFKNKYHHWYLYYTLLEFSDIDGVKIIGNL